MDLGKSSTRRNIRSRAYIIQAALVVALRDIMAPLTVAPEKQVGVVIHLEHADANAHLVCVSHMTGNVTLIFQIPLDEWELHFDKSNTPGV